MFAQLSGLAEPVLGVALFDQTFVTAGRHGNLYMHQIRLEKSVLQKEPTEQPVPVKPWAVSGAHKMSMAASAFHPTKGWCATTSGTLIKLWQVATHSRTFNRDRFYETPISAEKFLGQIFTSE
jgi:hypothetical protein